MTQDRQEAAIAATGLPTRQGPRFAVVAPQPAQRGHYGHDVPLALAADIAELKAAAKEAGRTLRNEDIVDQAFRLLPDDAEVVAGMLEERGLLAARTVQRRKLTCNRCDPAWQGRLARLQAGLLRQGHQVPEWRLYTLAVGLAVEALSG